VLKIVCERRVAEKSSKNSFSTKRILISHLLIYQSRSSTRRFKRGCQGNMDESNNSQVYGEEDTIHIPFYLNRVNSKLGVPLRLYR